MVSIKKIPQRLACIIDDLIDFRLKSQASTEQGLPLIITGAPRSATTTVEEIFNSDSVFLHHEPFIKNTILWNKTLASTSNTMPIMKETVANTYANIIKGKSWSNYRKSGRWYPYITKMALHKTLPLAPRRVIIKDPGISFCLDTFTPLIGEHLGLILLRNPLSIVTSLKKLKWDPLHRLQVIYSHSYFKRFDLEKDGLTAEKIVQLQPIERMALQTALLHHFLLQHAQHLPNYQIVKVEQLLASPYEQFSQLANSLQFSTGYLDAARINQITAIDKHPIKRHTFERNSSRYIRYWENNLSKEECELINYYYNLFNQPYTQ